ncbi:hypothetical protein FHS18_004600 [Paenibacillus phyllosphaerae]|uniref:SLH domain-containing protein n=1 Tax=Paenibacillus phyllosphaerae TaxID=274593 RepID=A0A7W5FPZ1_9BACL|nr:hypothetical protein [Paenibacillus phyllosphaerae]
MKKHAVPSASKDAALYPVSTPPISYSRPKLLRILATGVLGAIVLQASLPPSTVNAASNEIDVPAVSVESAASGSGLSDTTGPGEELVITSIEKGLDPADAKITKEQAVEMLRGWFPALAKAELDGLEYGTPNSYPSPKQAIWRVHWSIREGNNISGFSSAIDAMTGDLLEFHLPYEQADSNPSYYPPKVNREQAKQIALEWVRKASPSIKPSELVELEGDESLVQPSALFGPVQHPFQFQVLVNGVVSNADRLHMVIDGNGQLSNLYRIRYQGTYPSAASKLSESEALARMTESLELMPAYIPQYTDPYLDDAKLEWKLGYVPLEGTFGILDAISGELLREDGELSKPLRFSAIPKGSSLFQPNNGSQLTVDQAEGTVLRYASLPEGYERNRANLDVHYRDKSRKVWTINWQKAGDGPQFGFDNEVSATVDAVSGQILSVSRFDYRQDESASDKPSSSASLNEAEAKQRALQWIGELYPHAADTLKLAGEADIIPEGDAAYRFRFQRFEGDYAVLNHTVSLTLGRDGKLYNYDTSEYAPIFEPVKPTPQFKLTVDEAVETYRKAIKLELKYAQFGGGYNLSLGKETEAIMKLVYTPQLSTYGLPYLDGVTGNLLQQYLPEDTGSGASEEPADLTGHWAEEPLRTLLDYQIIQPDENGLIRPDEAIALGEWLTMVTQALGGGWYGGGNAEQAFQDIDASSPYAAAVQLFVSRGWLDASPGQALEPEQRLTRAKLAELLTGMVNYKKLSSFMNTDVTVSGLKDASAIADKGAAAIVLRLGLLSPIDGKFMPEAPVTKAQAATVMMRLVRLQGKLDASIM